MNRIGHVTVAAEWLAGDYGEKGPQHTDSKRIVNYMEENEKCLSPNTSTRYKNEGVSFCVKGHN